jgi:hypothetical protein
MHGYYFIFKDDPHVAHSEFAEILENECVLTKIDIALNPHRSFSIQRGDLVAGPNEDTACNDPTAQCTHTSDSRRYETCRVQAIVATGRHIH